MREPRLLIPLAFALAACGGTDSEGGAASESAAQPSAVSAAACDLVTTAEAEAIVGPAEMQPTAREITGMAGERATSCVHVGSKGTLMVRLWQPYGGSESTSESLVTRVQTERAEQAAAETDPELKKLTTSATISAYDGLGVPAALEDKSAGLGGVTLHVIEPAAKAYLAIDADNTELARAAAERALPRLH